MSKYQLAVLLQHWGTSHATLCARWNLHTHTLCFTRLHCARSASSCFTRSYILDIYIYNFQNCHSLEHTTRSFPSRSIAFGSCICFEEQFLTAIHWDLSERIRSPPNFWLCLLLYKHASATPQHCDCSLTRTILHTHTHTHTHIFPHHSL